MRLSYRKSIAIVESVGMAYDDETKLAFTVCGGQLVNGNAAPDWIKELNGECVLVAAEDIIKRKRSLANPECQTCLGTGLEARHQICRDCDEDSTR